MKIILILTHSKTNVGYARFSHDLIKFLQKRGNEVLVICDEYSDNIKDVRQLVMLSGPLDFKKNFWFAWIYLFRLARYRKELREFDLIHCVPEVYSFFTYLLSKCFGIKYFLHTHGTFAVLFFKYKTYGLLQGIAYKKAHKIICVSDYTKKRILEEKKNLTNLTVVPNGVNLNNFEMDKNIDFSNKENIILSVGSLKTRKGFDLLIKAIAIAQKKMPDIKCYIVGGEGKGAHYYNYLVDLAKKEKAENIFVLKKITDQELRVLYNKAKLFVMTTVSDKYSFDGFGMVYLEANAYGVPVIGSYDSGAEEAIRDGYNGFLAKPKDINDIADKILKILENQNLYDKMSENSLNWAKKLSWENTVNEYIEIYKH